MQTSQLRNIEHTQYTLRSEVNFAKLHHPMLLVYNHAMWFHFTAVYDAV